MACRDISRSDQLKNIPARNHGTVGLRRREKHAHNLAIVGKGSPATGTNLDVAQKKPSGCTSARAPDCRSNRTQAGDCTTTAANRGVVSLGRRALTSAFHSRAPNLRDAAAVNSGRLVPTTVLGDMRARSKTRSAPVSRRMAHVKGWSSNHPSSRTVHTADPKSAPLAGRRSSSCAAIPYSLRKKKDLRARCHWRMFSGGIATTCTSSATR